MQLKKFIEKLQELDGDIEIYINSREDILFDPEIEPTEDCETFEYYYLIVCK